MEFQESALVDGDQVICTPGGPEATMVALNKKTGETLWKTNLNADGTGNTEGNKVPGDGPAPRKPSPGRPTPTRSPATGFATYAAAGSSTQRAPAKYSFSAKDRRQLCATPNGSTTPRSRRTKPECTPRWTRAALEAEVDLAVADLAPGLPTHQPLRSILKANGNTFSSLPKHSLVWRLRLAKFFGNTPPPPTRWASTAPHDLPRWHPVRRFRLR